MHLQIQELIQLVTIMSMRIWRNVQRNGYQLLKDTATEMGCFN